MFNIDPRIRGIPAGRDQVVALFQSINAPNLAVPGKQAGPAQAFVVGVRGQGGLAVFVYLYLAESQDCAVYAPRKRNLTPEAYRTEEAEAMAFVESMGFMMDNMNYPGLSADDKDQMIKTLPVFQKDPKLVQAPRGKAAGGKLSPAAALGRLFASF